MTPALISMSPVRLSYLRSSRVAHEEYDGGKICYSASPHPMHRQRPLRYVTSGQMDTYGLSPGPAQVRTISYMSTHFALREAAASVQRAFSPPSPLISFSARSSLAVHTSTSPSNRTCIQYHRSPTPHALARDGIASPSSSTSYHHARYAYFLSHAVLQLRLQGGQLIHHFLEVGLQTSAHE